MKNLIKISIVVSTLLFHGIGVLPVSGQVLKMIGQSFILDDDTFDMWGVRVASASQKEEYTRSMISNLDDYKAEGINTLAVYLQGSSGGYSDPFAEDGKSVDPGHLERIKRIIEECAQRNMVVIAGIFYQRTIQNPEICHLGSEEDVRNAVRTVTQELKPYRNVIINIANEQNSGQYNSFQAFSFNDPQNIISLCKEVKSIDPERIVGGGGYNDSLNAIIGKSGFVDVLLFDTSSGDVEKGQGSDWHFDWFKKQGVPEKPMINVEIFGGWTGRFLPQGVYPEEGKKIHLAEIEAAKKQPGLYVFFHSNPWFQGVSRDLHNRYDLGGMGTLEDPGVRWFFDKINEN